MVAGWIGSTVLSINIDLVSFSIVRVVLQDSDLADPVILVEINLPPLSLTHLCEGFVSTTSAASFVFWVNSTKSWIFGLV